MDDRQLVKISKYLSKHLRHQPERLGLTLAHGGWVPVEDLIAACRRNNFPISRAELDEVVRRNDKRRFSYDATGRMIRANQGHSVPVDLELEPKTPPPILYHGTTERSAVSILERGLSKMSRHHVHLSSTPELSSSRSTRRGWWRPVTDSTFRRTASGSQTRCRRSSSVRYKPERERNSKVVFYLELKRGRSRWRRRSESNR
jgi:putative RNA 2'-phosphotransferase